MPGSKKITESEFNNIKSMLRANTPDQVVVLADRSGTTIRQINNMNSFADYVEAKAKKAREYLEFKKTRGDITAGTRVGFRKDGTPRKRAKYSRAKGYKMMTEEAYKGLKAMLDNGITPKIVHQATGRSLTALSYIARTETFDQYLELQRQAHKPKVVVQETKIEVTEEKVESVDFVALAKDLVIALQNVSESLGTLRQELHLNSSTVDKLEERVINTEDYIRTFAEAVAERRRL